MTYRIVKKMPQFVIESEEYKLVKQALIISKRVLPPYSSKFFKEEIQAVSALCHLLIQGLGKRKL